MKTKILFSIIFIALACWSILFMNEKPVIKYFPTDDAASFLSHSTNLYLSDKMMKDDYKLKWEVNSNLNKQAYLRQDVSLLFVDGNLKGITGSWKENEKKIALDVELQQAGTSVFEAISVHHAETHYPKDQIRSIQKMSTDKLYVVDSPHVKILDFKDSKTKEEKEWEETINNTVHQQLQFEWRKWLTEKEINLDEYLLVPLTDLYVFEKKALPGLSQEETSIIISQLWEGLYKSFIIPFSEKKISNEIKVPIILFDKENNHLIVLFENEKKKVEHLYQVYSTNN